MAFRPQYAGARSSYNVSDSSVFSVAVSAASGGAGFTASGTIWLGLQAQTRVGFNQTNLIQVNYSAGQKITITIGTNARKNGEDIHKFLIVGSLTNNVSNIFRLAEYDGYNIDQITPTALPATITLQYDAHLELNDSVANPASLPTNSGLVNGMGRAVISTGKFYTYKATSTATVDGDSVLSATPSGRWLTVGTLSTAVSSLDALPGCNTSLDNLDSESDLLIQPPRYNEAGGTTTPIKYWVCNVDTGTTDEIPTGKRIGIDVYLNSELKSKLFSGKLKIIFRGYVNITTGELDTENADATGDMLYVDEITTYVYGKQEALVLQKPLEPGFAYMFDIYIEANYYDFKNLVRKGSAVSIYPFFYTQAGEYSPVGVFFGDAILVNAEPEARRVTAGGIRAATVLRGAGVVDNLQFPSQERTTINNLLVNTAGQKILIDGNGAVFLASPSFTVPDTEALRAIVGTTSGLSNPSAFSSTLTTSAANKGINVTLNHPCDSAGFGTIRINYPDVVAGEDYSVFNPSLVRIYLLRQSNSTLYVYTTPCLSQPNQLFTISSLSGTTISSVPTNSDSTFGLYSPGNVTLTENTTGTLPVDTYSVAFVYEYDGNQLTSVSHSTGLGCIPEINATFADAINTTNYWQIPVSIDDVRAIPANKCLHGAERKMIDGTELKELIYNQYETEPDNGINYFRPSFIASDATPGRWVHPVSENLTSDQVLALVLPYIIAL